MSVNIFQTKVQPQLLFNQLQEVYWRKSVFFKMKFNSQYHKKYQLTKYIFFEQLYVHSLIQYTLYLILIRERWMIRKVGLKKLPTENQETQKYYISRGRPHTSGRTRQVVLNLPFKHPHIVIRPIFSPYFIGHCLNCYIRF